MTLRKKTIEAMAMAIAVREKTWLGGSAKAVERKITREGGPSPLHLRQARHAFDAAIAVLMNPSDELIDAGDRAMPEAAFYSMPDDAPRTWRAMLKAAAA